MSIPILNIQLKTNIKNVKKQRFHPKMMNVAQSKIYIIPFFKITEALIEDFNKKKHSILEIFSNKNIIIEFIKFLKDKLTIPKDDFEKNENTKNTISIILNDMFKKDNLLFLANRKYRIYSSDIDDINLIPNKNEYNINVDILLVHVYKDAKKTDIKMECKLRKQRILNLINKTFKINYDIGDLSQIYKDPYYKYIKGKKKTRRIQKKQGQVIKPSH